MFMQKTPISKIRLACVSTGLALLSSMLRPPRAFGQTSGTRDLVQVDLGDLMDTDVTSVSRKEQKLAKTAAAVFVMNQDEIRRSGASNIPDLLRMAPGVNVARIDTHTWAISIRGFNDMYVDKVLVLIDGRSVYRTNFSGVHWDEIDLPVEDIDRIEVIRGPGGTVWGAMNGVVKIITRSSRDTQGGLLSTGVGSETTASSLAQYGGQIRSAGAWRAFSKYFNVNNAITSSGQRAADGWHAFHEGFRTDWDLSRRDTLMAEGDVLQNDGGENDPDEVPSKTLSLIRAHIDKTRDSSGNFLARWDHTLANGSTTSLQFYDDYYARRTQGLRESANTIDLDFQHHFLLGERNDIVWGGDVRVASTGFISGINIAFLPLHRVDPLFSSFFQDEIRITDTVSLTFGSKFEHNSYTGFEYEPSAQLVWEMTRRQTFWLSAARAIRQPARRDYGILVNLALLPLNNDQLGILQLRGTHDPKTEQLRDFEIGHRIQPGKRFSLDSVVFLSFYRRLASPEPQPPGFTTNEGPPHLVFPLVFDYKAHAHNYGLETFANWRVTDRWTISTGLSMLHMNIIQEPSSQGRSFEDPGLSSRRQFSLRSSLNLTRRLEWNASLGWTGQLSAIPAYTRLDTSVGWRAGELLEFSLTAQNLLSPHHPEYPDEDNIAHSFEVNLNAAKEADLKLSSKLLSLALIVRK
jgi:iron complex outermembrane receptor protein